MPLRSPSAAPPTNRRLVRWGSGRAPVDCGEAVCSAGVGTETDEGVGRSSGRSGRGACTGFAWDEGLRRHRRRVGAASPSRLGGGGVDRAPQNLGGGQGCIRREGTSEAAPEAVRQAVGEGFQSGWGRLLSVTNAIEAGTWRQGSRVPSFAVYILVKKNVTIFNAQHAFGAKLRSH